MEQDYFKNISDMENHGGLPKGWLIIGFLIIIWCVYYFFAYTPKFSGWTQYDQYEESIRD